MRNITDLIEQYLKQMLLESAEGIVEIQRNELADKFSCVPSQINYVIATRFTLERGYLVESKRGGGGYIRIRKLELPAHQPIHEHVLRTIGNRIDQAAAEGLIMRLEEANLLNGREARILKAAVSREAIAVNLPLRDELRARMLKAMLVALLVEDQ